MNIKTIGIGAGIGAAIASGVIFGLQAALKSARRKGKKEGIAEVYEEELIATNAVNHYKRSRFSFLKKKGKES